MWFLDSLVSYFPGGSNLAELLLRHHHVLASQIPAFLRRIIVAMNSVSLNDHWPKYSQLGAIINRMNNFIPSFFQVDLTLSDSDDDVPLKKNQPPPRQLVQNAAPANATAASRTNNNGRFKFRAREKINYNE